MDILSISHLTKSFGGHTVLNDLCLSVPEHSIFGFIGQNGAGKTTTMKLILGLLKADSGEIFVNGQKVAFGQNRTNVWTGYLPDVPEFYGYMDAAEYLTLCGRISGMDIGQIRKQTARLLSLVGLPGNRKRIHTFSRGMKQRLGIAQALLNSPKLLICDEPTSALDPIGRKEVLDILCSVKEQATVLFSTHILSDVERICSHVAFLQDGRIALNSSLEGLRRHGSGRNLEIEFFHASAADSFCTAYGGTHTGPASLRFAAGDERRILEVQKQLAQANIPVRRLELSEPALEELFLEYTQTTEVQG